MNTLTKILWTTAALAVLGTFPVMAEDTASTHSTVPLTDNQLMHHIRSAIVEDPSLPYCAHVVRVKTENGKVTLEGRVLTEGQKNVIEEKAAELAGEDNVTDNIKLKESSVATRRL